MQKKFKRKREKLNKPQKRFAYLNYREFHLKNFADFCTYVGDGRRTSVNRKFNAKEKICNYLVP